MIMKHPWSRLNIDPREFVHIEASWSLEALMVKSNSVECKHDWASISLPINHTSIVEEHWSIARLESIKIQSCTSRGHKIDSLNSQLCYANVVDLVVVIILSFESLISMHYCVRYGRLKFWWWNLFCSIHLMCDDPCLINAWFMICDVYAMCTCA